ncbi:MAG: polymer-forming cytoskeletal protein [Acidimicrobiia bacterium]|nr:polymer-forming cytoskeletal protein [Acidimicrobiia bacterium]
MLLLLSLLTLVAAPGWPDARNEDFAARASADVVLVREGEVVDEDLYAGANTVTIEGTVEGDLVVWAFDRLEISGTVEGDVYGYASSVSLSGDVGGSVRLVSLDLRLDGAVGGDVLAFAWTARNEGSVGRDLLAWASTLTVRGDVGRDVEGQTLNATYLNGQIGRDFQMTVGSLDVGPETVVAQDLIYQAATDAPVPPEASVGGTITRRAPAVPNVRLSAVRFVSLLLGVLAFVWIGMLMIWMMPQTMREATEAVATRPLRSFVVGIVAFLMPVLLAASIIALAVLSPPDLALTILGIGAPVWLSLLVVLLLGIVLAPVPVAIAVGRRILGRSRSAFAGYLFGVVIYLAMLLIPYVGLPIAGLAAFVGLGALARGAVRARGSLRWATGEVRPNGHRRARRSKRLLESDEPSDMSHLDPFHADDGLHPGVAPVSTALQDQAVEPSAHPDTPDADPAADATEVHSDDASAAPTPDTEAASDVAEAVAGADEDGPGDPDRRD